MWNQLFFNQFYPKLLKFLPKFDHSHNPRVQSEKPVTTSTEIRHSILGQGNLLNRVNTEAFGTYVHGRISPSTRWLVLPIVTNGFASGHGSGVRGPPLWDGRDLLYLLNLSFRRHMSTFWPIYAERVLCLKVLSPRSLLTLSHETAYPTLPISSTNIACYHSTTGLTHYATACIFCPFWCYVMITAKLKMRLLSTVPKRLALSQGCAMSGVPSLMYSVITNVKVRQRSDKSFASEHMARIKGEQFDNCHPGPHPADFRLSIKMQLPSVFLAVVTFVTSSWASPLSPRATTLKAAAGARYFGAALAAPHLSNASDPNFHLFALAPRVPLSLKAYNLLRDMW